jgi:hypothetical protein
MPNRRAATAVFVAAIGLAGTSVSVGAAQNLTSQAAAARDGQRDFDWEIGTWTTKVRVRRNPLSGAAPDWAEYEGTSVVKPLLDGRANFVELSISGARGKIEGGALRLYNPQARQWSLNYASLGNGMLTAPVFGGFDGRERGVFYGQDMLEGRAILVRFIVTRMSPREARFEQAYSTDGGRSWEDNWIAVDSRR